MNALSLQDKVLGLSRIISDRKLFVDTNYDIFTGKTTTAQFGETNKYQLTLLDPETKGHAYASSLLIPVLTCIQKRATCLTMGGVGLGKTTGAEWAGHFLTDTPIEDILEGTIQGHTQQTLEAMVAYLDLGLLTKEGKRVPVPQKFMTVKVHLLDEIRRLDPNTMATLLRLIDNGMTTYQGHLIVMEPGPVFATANYDDEGSFQLLPPAADRFDVALMISSPSSMDASTILTRKDEKLNGNNIESLLAIPENLRLSEEDLTTIRSQIRDITTPQEIENYLCYIRAMMRFCEVASADPSRMTKGNAWQIAPDEATSEHYLNTEPTDRVASHRMTRNELSVRTHKALDRYSKAFAWLQGRKQVSLEDIRTMWPFTTWHRLTPSKHALQQPGNLYANDRIGFAKTVFERCIQEYEWLKNTDLFTTYSAGYRAIESDCPLSKKHQIAQKCIKKMGTTTHPYALALAQSLASEYNTQANNNHGIQT